MRDDERREAGRSDDLREDAAGIPDLSGPPEAQEATGDPVDEQMPPAERPRAAESWGTTAAEQRIGRPLGERLAEESEAGDPKETPPHVTLLGEDDPDRNAELTGSGAPGRHRDASAEEEAVRTRPSAPGATNRPDSYVDEAEDTED